MKVRLKKGARLTVSPAVAYKELERIRKDGGGDIKLAKVVADSKLKDAPLHNEFEWSNTRAGHLWRLKQARQIVGSIEIIRHERPNIQSRAYEVTTLPPKGEKEAARVYRTTEDILKDPIARDELLAQAIRDAIAYRKRYNALSELSQVFRALDGFLEGTA